jgi:ribosomal protein S6
LCFALLASPALAADEPAPDTDTVRFERHLEREGVAVDVEVAPLRDGGTFREGEPVLFRFHVTDTNTGEPYSSLYPAAWMDRLPEVPEENPDSCKQKVESFVGGTLLAQAELDLNVYYVLALNDDATVSVVDPLFGFGSSKLLTMAFLEAPGHDWVLTEDQRVLFVSMPEADAVAAISTADWKVMANIETGPNPGRLALQPDGEYLWVAYRDPKPGADRSGVTAIEVETLRRAADVPTGNGDHDLVLDDDGRLYVTDPADGAVSVVDTGALEVILKIETAAEPASLAYTPAGQAVYVSHRSGWITAIDADRLEVTARIEAEPGLGDIRFVPETRLALVVNPEEDVLHIVDAAARKIVQTGDMEGEPDQIGLSDELAYVRHRKSEHILMIPLDEIGREGAPVPVIDFPGGQHPAGGHASPTPARGIVQAPGATAVLVANPGGVKTLSYRLRKNRKAHYVLLNVDAPSAVLNEIERQERLNEDVLRYITIRVDEHEEGPSAMMRKVDRDREREDRGFGFRDRGGGGGGFRGDRDRGGGGGFRGDRDRDSRPPRDADSAPSQE